MSRVCQSCNRGPQVGMNRSKSMVGTKRRWLINLQSKKVGGKKIKICAKCVKTSNKKTS